MSFEKMRVHQAAELLDRTVQELIHTMPRGHSADIDQLNRAVASVVYNIAEAYGCDGSGRKRNHLYIARGSADETRAILRRQVRTQALTAPAIQRPSVLARTIAKMLTAWLKTLPDD